MNSDLEMVEDGLLKVPDACKFLSVSRSRLYLWIEQGELPSVRLGRSRRIPKRALMEFTARHLERRQDGVQQAIAGPVDEAVA
jgi:excisionase family DNA binding protein